VRRLTAPLLVLAMLALSGGAPLLHLHAYGDHEHPEHQHGLAAHEHRHAVHPAHDTDAVEGSDHATVESCEPGQHTVSLVMRGTTVTVFTIAMVEAESAASASPSRPSIANAPFEDVRVHGPPRRSRLPARAPPLDLPA
jgi:hypothetical protein